MQLSAANPHSTLTFQVLDRARKAEAEVVELKAQLKAETTMSKKTIREMDTALSESTVRSQKSEREYITLRDSLKGLVEGFKVDHDRLREEMRKREDRVRKEAEDVAKKYKKLVAQVTKEREDRGAGLEEIVRLKEESEKMRKEMEDRIREEVNKLRGEVDKNALTNDATAETAKYVAILPSPSFIDINDVRQKSCRRTCTLPSHDAYERCSFSGC